MKTFAPPKRKLIELGIMIVLTGIFYVIYPVPEALTLFVFGYVWNWAASNELSSLFENKRYRMSLLKTVVNLQNLILKPFGKAPDWVKRILRIFPAGIFWGMVIFINESFMPWWATFIGSAAFELVNFEMDFLQRRSETPPELPREL